MAPFGRHVKHEFLILQNRDFIKFNGFSGFGANFVGTYPDSPKVFA
jgi:hypothetical protein